MTNGRTAIDTLTGEIPSNSLAQRLAKLEGEVETLRKEIAIEEKLEIRATISALVTKFGRTRVAEAITEDGKCIKF